MLFWILALAITGIVCAALYYASGTRVVNATTGTDAVRQHHRQQLEGINADLSAGRLAEPEALAAKRELAREVMKLEAESRAAQKQGSRLEQNLLPLGVLVIAVLGFAIYSYTGRPEIPSQPLAGREPEQQVPNIDIDAAVKQIEAQMLKTPDDVRGWQALAPVYRQTGRFADLVTALRNINRLTGPTAVTETDLAEALMQANNSAEGEATQLLESAAARDPKDVRPRFYLAGEATRTGDYAKARDLWNQVLALATQGDEPWLQAARSGLAMAEAGLKGGAAAADSAAGNAEQSAMISSMVAQLNERLTTQGGTVAEWTQLVRSQLVLGQRDAAQQAYDAAKAAYPDPAARAELDALAKTEGLN